MGRLIPIPTVDAAKKDAAAWHVESNYINSNSCLGYRMERLRDSARSAGRGVRA